MWLPSKIYECMPQFWLLLGVLFFTFGLYLGFDFEMIYGYLALGAACIAWSIGIFQARKTHRNQSASAAAERDSGDVSAHSN